MARTTIIVAICRQVVVVVVERMAHADGWKFIFINSMNLCIYLHLLFLSVLYCGYIPIAEI